MDFHSPRLRAHSQAMDFHSPCPPFQKDDAKVQPQRSRIARFIAQQAALAQLYARLRNSTSKTVDQMKIKAYLCTMFRYHTYGKSELAQLYSPHLTTSAARRKLMSWIARQPQLLDELHRSGFTLKTHTFTPYQVRLIVDALGEP